MAAQAQASASLFTTGMRYDIDGRVVGTIAPDPVGAGSIAYAAARNTYYVNGLEGHRSQFRIQADQIRRMQKPFNKLCKNLYQRVGVKRIGGRMTVSFR